MNKNTDVESNQFPRVLNKKSADDNNTSPVPSTQSEQSSAPVVSSDIRRLLAQKSLKLTKR